LKKHVIGNPLKKLSSSNPQRMSSPVAARVEQIILNMKNNIPRNFDKQNIIQLISDVMDFIKTSDIPFEEYLAYFDSNFIESMSIDEFNDSSEFSIKQLLCYFVFYACNIKKLLSESFENALPQNYEMPEICYLINDYVKNKHLKLDWIISNPSCDRENAASLFHENPSLNAYIDYCVVHYDANNTNPI